MRYTLFFLLIFILGCSSIQTTTTVNKDNPTDITFTTNKLKGKVVKGKEIDIFYKDQYVSSMSLTNYKILIDKADSKTKEQIAEEKGKVQIVLKDSPWDLGIGKSYKTSAQIIWTDENGKILKEIRMNIQITRETNNDFRIISLVVWGSLATALSIVFAILLILALI